MYYVVKASDGKWYVACNGTLLEHSYGACDTREEAESRAATAHQDWAETQSDRAAWYDQN